MNDIGVHWRDGIAFLMYQISAGARKDATLPFFPDLEVCSHNCTTQEIPMKLRLQV